ncbi:MAG: PQQ-binding-like beta-propeller repeat protein [Verrucomicrobiales bacterium]|nr:PQQ-binding-like beta-propeller repeat protein [Verrucomicrobiales bacterium]
MKSFLRLASLGLVALFGPAVYVWIQLQEMTYLNWFLVGTVILWALLFGLWHLIFGRVQFGKRLARFFGVIGGFLVLGFILSQLLRYEGSASGSSFPKLAWVWEPEDSGADEPSEFVQTDLSEEEERLVRAMGDSTDFLGPDRNGTFPAASFSMEWSENPPELLWRRPVGKAWSGFAVKGHYAVTQEQAADAERVLCLDLFTGDEIWKHDNPGTRLLLVKEENQGAAMGGDGPRSTPVIDENNVFALGATGILNCLDLATGNEIWTRNVISDFDGEVQKWGSANAALIIAEDGLVVVPGSDKTGATLVAFDLMSGTDRWVYRGDGASYSSPRLMEIGGTTMIVSVNQKDVTGHVPASGELLWKYDWPGSFPKVGQPVSAGENLVLVTASYGVGSPLLEVKQDGTGAWKVSQLWKSTRMKTKFSTSFIIGDYAYGIDEGRLASIHLSDGSKAWKNQKVGFGQQLLFGDELLVQTERGPVIAGHIGPEGFEETSRLEALSSMTWNVPTVAGRFLLVRNDQEAACYLLPPRK